MSDSVDLNRLMWLGLGAGSKGAVAGMVGGVMPEGAEIAPDVLTGFAGFFLAQQKGRRLSVFGEGMLIASIGQIVREPLEKIFERFKPKSETTKTTTETKGGTVSTSQLSPEDALILQKYGIVA